MNIKILKNFLVKNSQIKFSEIKNKQKEFLNKLNTIKTGKKTVEEKEAINNHEKCYLSREEKLLIFLNDYIEILSDVNYDSKNSKNKGKGLKIINT